MPIVIDTNVLISYFLSHDSTPGKAVYKAMERGSLIFTEPTFGELIAVLYREKFDRYTNAKLRKELLHHLLEGAELVAVTRPIRACRDPADDKFLEAAVHGEAGFLITGDEDLLILNPYMDVTILSPGAFLEKA